MQELDQALTVGEVTGRELKRKAERLAGAESALAECQKECTLHKRREEEAQRDLASKVRHLMRARPRGALQRGSQAVRSERPARVFHRRSAPTPSCSGSSRPAKTRLAGGMPRLPWQCARRPPHPGSVCQSHSTP